LDSALTTAIIRHSLLCGTTAPSAIADLSVTAMRLSPPPVIIIIIIIIDVVIVVIITDYCVM